MTTQRRNRLSLWVYAALAIAAWWVYQSLFGPCEKYASQYSCGYLLNDADYEVFYWRSLSDDNPDDDRLIGRVVGLRACKDTAIRYSTSIDDQWNERAYICVLVKNGEYQEKHRLLD